MPNLYNRILEYQREQFNRDMLAGHEVFPAMVAGKAFMFDVHPDLAGYGWWAMVPDMYEPGSPYGAHSLKSREDAALKLVEQIEEITFYE